MSVKGQGQMQKNAKFHFTPIFCGLEKSIYSFHSHKILQTCSKIYTLTAVFHLGFKRGMAPPIMNAGHPVDRGGHFQHQPSPIKGTNRISLKVCKHRQLLPLCTHRPLSGIAS